MDREKEKIKLGKRVREAREFVGWTQEKLATAIDMDAITIGRIENGKHETMYFTIIAIAKALGISAQHLESDK